MSTFIRKTKTASGATAVQIVTKRGSDIVAIDHIGSAHNDADLAGLMESARQKLHKDQLRLDLFAEDTQVLSPELMVMKGSYSKLLWKSLETVYESLGFDELEDIIYKDLVLARIIEPTSKLDTIRVLGELGISDIPTNSSIHRCLRRSIDNDYRAQIEQKCFEAANPAALNLLLYDVTTLYFEIQKEDGYRVPGMSKERRLEPQITIGLLCASDGFPLEVQSFEGNRAEVKTIIEVLSAFKARHPHAQITVTADAAMLSSKNITELEELGYHYIIASRIAKVPYEIEEYEKEPGQELEDGQIFDLSVPMNTGRGTKRVNRRVIYQYRQKRASLDLRNIEKAVAKAEKMVKGTTDFKRNRFLVVKDGKREINYALIEKSKLKAGVKGYVTDLDIDAQQVIDAYHQLFQVEKSFRMSKSDLKARPIFHHKRDSIEAHLTIVFAALAISRFIENKTEISIKKYLQILKPIRTGIVAINGRQCEIEPEITGQAIRILKKLDQIGY